MAYAPNAIQTAAAVIVEGIPDAINAGIVGDVNHSFGYHLAADELDLSDYSRQLARDRVGIDGGAASALDITNRTPELWATTARLRAAAKAGDPRLFGLREFAGTLDGVTTYAYDLSTGRESFGTWDKTHLFHNHLSGYRDCANNKAAWLAIADVMIGKPDAGGALTPTPESQEDEDMATNARLIRSKAGAVMRVFTNGTGKPTAVDPDELGTITNLGDVDGEIEASKKAGTWDMDQGPFDALVHYYTPGA